jgi:two-component system OmpR family sensor kinase
MLGQIERAFAKQQASEERLRRFLSDAAHELRTPLTSIRGYAELFRLGATARPADTAKAMARIEEEAARMGILVEELLALARLDEMPATTREPVDLAPLLADAADDARAVAADRSVTVAVEGTARGAPSAHVVLGDPHQLRQVLANLMGNAIKHTPAGTPIELTLQRRAGMACPRIQATPCSSASGARRRGANGARQGRGSVSRSSPRSSARTAGKRRRATHPVGERRS